MLECSTVSFKYCLYVPNRLFTLFNFPDLAIVNPSVLRVPLYILMSSPPMKQFCYAVSSKIISDLLGFNTLVLTLYTWFLCKV